MIQANSRRSRERKKRTTVTIIFVTILIAGVLVFLLSRTKEYEITFDSNGGSEISSVKVKKNEKVMQPNEPNRENYTLAGWYYQDELYNFDTPINSNMTLRAEWENIGEAEVEGLSLNVTELAMAPNGNDTLTATLLPENAKQVNLVWGSSDESIATVDENGNIKAIKNGKATITVSTEDKQYSASATVNITTKPSSQKNNASKTSENEKQGNYVIHLKSREMGATGDSMQYDFWVTKDGTTFTDYTVFNYNKRNISKTSGSVRSGAVDKNVTKATITLTDGSVKNATVQIN